MHLMYVDGSGDPGLQNSPTRYFVLSGVVVHELRWQPCLDQMVAFRRRMRAAFGLKLREEIHAAAMINRPGRLVRIPRNDRLTILRGLTDELATMPDISIINVIVDKKGKEPDCDIFAIAWKVLLQRYENTISNHNFPGPSNPDERGIVFADHTDDKKLVQLLRQMRKYNPVPNQPRFGIGYRDLQIRLLVEDPSFRDSRHSYYVQAADLVAFLLYQFCCPSTYIRRKSAHNYLKRLEPILCKVASSKDPLGIVRL
jgi:hypothetical protein